MKHNVQIINKNTKATSMTSFCKCYLGMFCSHGRNRNQPIKFTLKINFHVFIWAERWFWKIVHKKTDKWYIEWQRVVRVSTNDNEWQTTSGTTSGKTRDNEWQEMTTNDNEWKWVVILANFLFFSNRRGTYHYAPKRNSLNTEEDLEDRLLK